MATRLHHLSLVLLVGGVALGGTQRTGSADPTDLDKLTIAQLNADLEAELDDIYEGHTPDEPADIDELEEEILDALADAGDDGLEVDIDREDLDAEMEEAGTTLEDVVADALSGIDQASGPAARSPRFLYASFGSHDPASVRTTRRLAVRETKKQIITAIQSVRR